MTKFEDLYTEVAALEHKNVVKIILSAGKGNLKRVSFRPIVIKGEKKWQEEKIINNKAIHTNINLLELSDKIKTLLAEIPISNINIILTDNTISYRISKKNKLFRTMQKNSTVKEVTLSHNKEKNYILKEGDPIEPLVDLGVFSADYKVNKSKYDKYKQINRFVEIIAHELADFNESSLKIIDFGCGKSYLTFILYYYFCYIKKINVSMIGYDLKEDVILNCNNIAKKYGYDNLIFKVGDVSEIETSCDIDAIVSLHACDTATDYALHYAMKNRIKYIFSVPCCQHEINAQIKSSNELSLLLKHGLYKERFCALLTDAIRCEVLKSKGYEVDVVEFVDIENTPKNAMIRARCVSGATAIRKNNQLFSLIENLGIEPTIIKLEEESAPLGSV